MKVQSWRTLFVTVFIGGGGLIFFLKIAIAGDKSYYATAVILVWCIIRGLCVSFIEEEWEEEQKQIRASKKVFRKRFGRFAPIAPYGSWGFVCLGIGVVYLFPDAAWFLWVCLIFALIYTVWLRLTIPKQIKAEIEQKM